MNIHEQARAEADRCLPSEITSGTERRFFIKGYIARAESAEKVDGLDAAMWKVIAMEKQRMYEAATRTREWSSIDPPPGWFTFGTHVEHDGPLEFSEAVGDDLMPLWERPATHPRVVTTVTELDALTRERTGRMNLHEQARSEADQTPALARATERMKVSMLGTTDGDLIDADVDVPAGEMFRLAAEALPGALSAALRDPDGALARTLCRRIHRSLWPIASTPDPEQPGCSNCRKHVDVLRAAILGMEVSP